MTRALVALLLLLSLLATGPGMAHETTRSYLSLSRSGATVQADLRIAFRDVAVLVWLDADLDGALTWAEVTARQDDIAAYAAARIDIGAGGRCAMALRQSTADDSGGIGYLDLRFRGTCPDATAPLTVSSRLLDDIDPDHRLFLTVATPDGPAATVLGRDSPAFSVAAQGEGLADSLRRYFAEGVEHLLAGPDHIAFLLLLILPAVAGNLPLRTAAAQVLTAITGFTLAHAVTLTVASSTVLRPPTDLVGALVALTVVLTAADNLRPFLPGPRAAAAAFFGLIHGFGFATVLADTGLSGPDFLAVLLAFNLGIEAGQVAVVAATAFALAALRGGQVLVVAGSVAGGSAGLYWAALAMRTALAG